MSAFDDWYNSTGDELPVGLGYALPKMIWEAGRAYQREVDAKIAEKTVVGIDDNGLYNDPLEEVARAIREQKID